MKTKTDAVKNRTQDQDNLPDENAVEPVIQIRSLTFKIEGLAPLSWTKFIPPKAGDEDGKTYEEREWKTKFHSREDGTLLVPSMGLRNSFAQGGKDEGIGRGAARAKNLIRTATIPSVPYYELDKKVSDLRGEWRMMPSNPARDSGARVPKLLPMLDEWSVTGELQIVDERLTEDLMARCITRGGFTCGVGALRVEGGGVLGRYKLVSLKIT